MNLESKQKETNIEKISRESIERRGIKCYEKQIMPIPQTWGFQPTDLAVMDYGKEIYIEVHGEHFLTIEGALGHHTDFIRRRDKAKEKIILSANKILLYFWEDLIIETNGECVADAVVEEIGEDVLKNNLINNYTSNIGTFMIRIKGTSPFLMNNPNDIEEQMEGDTKVTNSIKKKKDQIAEAEKRAIRDTDGDFCVKASQIKTSMVKTAQYFPQQGGRDFNEYLKLAYIPNNELKLKYDKKPEVDITPKFVRKNLIPRCRYKFNDWEIEIPFEIRSPLINVYEVRTILNAAGRLCGIGDERPQLGKNDVYGTFEVIDIVRM